MITAADTSPEGAAVQVEAYRRLGPEARVELAARLSDEIRQVTRDGIRQRHPDYRDEEVLRALLRLVVGDEPARAACPGWPLVDP